MNTEDVSSYLSQQYCQWILNPPHGSHCGGVWERMIGICRRVLDSILADVGPARLTHEVLSTFMAEVMAIVNNWPLVPVSSDPAMPDVLTLSMVLTQKNLLSKQRPESSAKQTFVQEINSEDKCNTRQISFGQDGGRNFFICSSRDVNGEPKEDLVLLRCKELARNDWPIARINTTFPSADGKVRKVEVMTAKDGVKATYVRPVTEVVLLKKEDELNACN